MLKTGVRSSVFPFVNLTDKIPPFSLTTQCNLKPKNQPIVDLPIFAVFLNTLFLEMRFGLQTCIGVESIKEIPVGLSNLKAK